MGEGFFVIIAGRAVVEVVDEEEDQREVEEFELLCGSSLSPLELSCIVLA